MSDRRIYDVREADELERAGETDLVELVPLEGRYPMIVPKYTLLIVAYAISRCKRLHISGATGAGKTMLLDSLLHQKANLDAAMRAIGVQDPKPVRELEIDCSSWESSSEMWGHHALDPQRGTFHEDSVLVKGLIKLQEDAEKYYNVIWLKELGRSASRATWNPLLNLTAHRIGLPDGRTISASRVCFIADSNISVEEHEYSVLPVDRAVQRRFLPMTMPYLAADQEAAIVARLTGATGVELERIGQATRLVQLIRQKQREGELQTVSPPSIETVLNFIDMLGLPMSLHRIADHSLIGGASLEDERMVGRLFNSAFNVRLETQAADPALAGVAI